MNKRSLAIVLPIVAFAELTATSAYTATLRVAPISVRATHGTNAASVRIWNDGREPLNIQVRIFRWRVEKGKDILEPTRDVVVSPPMTTLVPGTENLIRIVRTTQRPVSERESYRLIVDQLPKAAGESKSGTITILLRHAIPVYFE
jgi:fimbrial chaperone protein